MTLTIHPAAELFPLLEGDEFTRLVESMRDGFDPLCPIVLYEGRILDGRNRYRACVAAGIEPRTIEYEGSDPWGEAVRLNIVRRHLTASQIAGLVVKSDALREEAERARERQGTRTDLNFVPPGGQSPGRSSQIIAREYGIGHSTLQRAQRVAREAPELLPRIIEGAISAKTAEREVRERMPMAEAAPPASGRSEWHRRKHHIDSNRVLRETAMSLQTVVTGLDLVEVPDLDVLEKVEYVASIRESLRLLNAFMRRLSA